MAQIDYEITIFYKAILHIFLASGALPLNPCQIGAHKIIIGPPNAIKWVEFPPHYELGFNAVIPMNKEDNRAPHPTIPIWRPIIATPSLLHLLDNASTLDLVVSHLHHHT